MILIINPIFLFLIGTLIGILPYLVNSRYFKIYRAFNLNNEIFFVYLLGFLSFIMGYLFIKFIFRKMNFGKYIVKKDLNLFIFVLIFISLIFFFKIIQLYGSVPIVSILTGNKNIEFINNIQKEVGGGLFGIFFLLIMSLIILFPYSIINKNSSKINFILFYLHLILLFIYCTYSGKRQMLFILFTYTFSYLLIYYFVSDNRVGLKKIKYWGSVFLFIIISLFLLIGLIRTNLIEENVSIFDPIVHYASLPFVNLTSIIAHQSSNQYAFSFMSFVDILISDLPTLIKSIFIKHMYTLENIPLIEPTSPSTVYGEIFWSFSYFGVFIFALSIGMISNYLYLKALYNKSMIYISMYSLLVWPLLSIHTYNHFKNFMFLIIPLSLIYFGNKFYINFIPRKRIVK